MALSCPRELRFILDAGIELLRRLPEQAERPLAAGMIPHAGGPHTICARHARHLAQSRDRVCHEVNDELRQGSIEHVIPERQLLRCAA